MRKQLVPADGVKGKTWGPSSGGHVLNSLNSVSVNSSSSKSRPSIPEERWTKSSPSLEKANRNKAGLPSVTSAPEIGGFRNDPIRSSSVSSSCQKSPFRALLSSPYFRRANRKKKSKQKFQFDSTFLPCCFFLSLST
jgi:hypothetical protein